MNTTNDPTGTPTDATRSSVRLTRNQKDALARLRRVGHLYVRSAAWHGTVQRTYNRVTLQALVDAGEARWAPIQTGRPGYEKTFEGIMPIDAPRFEKVDL